MDAYRIRERAWEHFELSMCATTAAEAQKHLDAATLLFARAREVESSAPAQPDTAVIL